MPFYTKDSGSHGLVGSSRIRLCWYWWMAMFFKDRENYWIKYAPLHVPSFCHTCNKSYLLQVVEVLCVTHQALFHWYFQDSGHQGNNFLDQTACWRQHFHSVTKRQNQWSWGSGGNVSCPCRSPPSCPGSWLLDCFRGEPCPWTPGLAAWHCVYNEFLGSCFEELFVGGWFAWPEDIC